MRVVVLVLLPAALALAPVMTQARTLTRARMLTNQDISQSVTAIFDPAAAADAVDGVSLAWVRAGLVDYGAEATSQRVMPAAAKLAAPTVLLKQSGNRAVPAGDDLDAMIALFALGAEVNVRKADLSADLLRTCARLEELGLLEANGPDALRSKVALWPLDVGALAWPRAAANAPAAATTFEGFYDKVAADAARRSQLLIATDFQPPNHRRACPKGEEACMYLSPCSLALADCTALVIRTMAKRGDSTFRVADLCAGSGVQGLVALAAAPECAVTVRAVEMHARAANFARLNSALNRNALPTTGMSAVSIDVGDELKYDVVVSNPPYVAVPEGVAYDAFANGGVTGEAVVSDCVKFASKRLSEGGVASIVLEIHGDPDLFAQRVGRWWAEAHHEDAKDGAPCPGFKCVVLVDRPPAAAWAVGSTGSTSAKAVAARRGGAIAETWAENYAAQGADTVTNGMVLLARGLRSDNDQCRYEYKCVDTPRLWAPPPTNVECRNAMHHALEWLMQR